MTDHLARRPVALALGSNLGDRVAHLQAAVEGLTRVTGDPAMPAVAISAVSSLYETDPVGGPPQPDYLNAVVVGESSLSAPDLLKLALEIEASTGRVRRERWGPRTLDVDLLTCGDEIWREPELTLPHPRAAQRAFVLVPWHDADPAAVLPGAGSVAGLIEALDPADLAGLRRRDDMSFRL